MSNNVSKILLNVTENLYFKSGDELKNYVEQNGKLIKPIISLFKKQTLENDQNQHRPALTCLCNLSEIELKDDLMSAIMADEDGFWLNIKENVFNLDKKLDDSELTCINHLRLALLINLTRDEKYCSQIYDLFGKHLLLINLIKLIDHPSIDKKIIYYISCLLANLSQLKALHALFIDQSGEKVLELVLNKLFQYIKNGDQEEVKLNYLYCVKNLCFEYKLHAKLLKNNSFIVNLVLPITGPTAIELDEEDNDQLPTNLQYLEEGKQRSTNFDLNRTILECLLLLCATAESRIKLRKLKVYFILREYHKVEKNQELVIAIENVVDILLKEEDEYEQFRNLLTIDISPDLTEKFKKEDETLKQN